VWTFDGPAIDLRETCHAPGDLAPILRGGQASALLRIDPRVCAITAPLGPDGVMTARAHLCLAEPSTSLALAHDAVGAWEDTVAGVDGEARRAAVAQVLWQHGVLAAQIHDRLTAASNSRIPAPATC
jgi:hypothetical protein